MSSLCSTLRHAIFILRPLINAIPVMLFAKVSRPPPDGAFARVVRYTGILYLVPAMQFGRGGGGWDMIVNGLSYVLRDSSL